MKTENFSPALVLAALGVVYGDIGTSPLYTLRESFAASHVAVEQANVFGFVSLIVWSLLLVVTLKYVLFIVRADNRGEGGVVVLTQLAAQSLRGRAYRLTLMVGLCAMALFFGDAVITPAVSVLSALEGLTVVNPHFEPLILPLALGILLALFAIQKFGSDTIGKLFGPVMLLWFGVLALMGGYQIARYPAVLQALNPYYGLHFALTHGFVGFASLGSVVLTVTGAEALYADMGHFGRKPIQTAWLGLVLPALAVNYIGQGALLLQEPQAIENPFFLSAPQWGLMPLVGLAAMATVIASQAVISGAYSMMQQAVQVGFSPRMQIIHTGKKEAGQIYMPGVNWLLLAAVVAVVLAFRNSANLAAAYGIAATGTMLMTTVLFAVVMRKVWRWPLAVAAGLTLVFLAIDLVFFTSNLLKLADGGWLPVLIAAFLVFTFSTWYRGKWLMAAAGGNDGLDMRLFVDSLQHDMPQNVAGSAVFMTDNAARVPNALLHNLKHNKILHHDNVLLTIHVTREPYVSPRRRLHVEPIAPKFVAVRADYGFKETPRIGPILKLMAKKGVHLDMMNTSFFMSRDSIDIAEHTPAGHMARWRTRYFKWLHRNSMPVTDYYRIPNNRSVEMGSRIRL